MDTLRFRPSWAVAVAFSGLLSIAHIGAAQAVPLVSGFGGEANFGENSLAPNDDQSSAEATLPFEVNFFGQTFDTFYVNTNGNITFAGPVSQFTPNPFPASTNPMIAPFWGDADTRCGTCGDVYFASPNDDTVVVTWNNVGYYSEHSNLVNNFQLILHNRAGDVEGGQVLPTGDFDIEFRYDRLEWTTGDASQGSGGFGGTPAQAGFDAGNHQDFFTLPGSRTADVLNLKNTTNVAGGPAGLWVFSVRQGGLPGSTPANPLMPVVSDAGWDFDFNVDPEEMVYIDPEIAVGYEYVVNSGPNFASVLLPTGIGDNMFDLYLWNGTDYVDSGDDLTGGIEYFFAAGGVSRFKILGIETAAALDPTDTTAFVTGLTFVSDGQVSMSQIPVVFDTDPQNPSDVPEPPVLGLLLVGLAGSVLLRARARRRRAA
jgi:hypothetical protein